MTPRPIAQRWEVLRGTANGYRLLAWITLVIGGIIELTVVVAAAQLHIIGWATLGLFLIIALITISISQNFFAQAEMIMLMIAIEENTRTVAQYANAATRTLAAAPPHAPQMVTEPAAVTPAPTPATNPPPWPFFPS